MIFSGIAELLPEKAFQLVQSYWIKIPLASIAVFLGINTGLTIYELMRFPRPRRLYLRLIGIISAAGLVTAGCPILLVFVENEKFHLSFNQAGGQSTLIFFGTFIALYMISRRYEYVAERERQLGGPLL
jgi:hypothetical protein